jgi:hypothetical protein
VDGNQLAFSPSHLSSEDFRLQFISCSLQSEVSQQYKKRLKLSTKWLAVHGVRSTQLGSEVVYLRKSEHNVDSFGSYRGKITFDNKSPKCRPALLGHSQRFLNYQEARLHEKPLCTALDRF